jgi:hypothetical protein
MGMSRKRIPHLKTDEQTAEFREKHCFAHYVEDTRPADDVQFPSRPLKQIPLCLAPRQTERLRRLAATKGIGYQAMLRVSIAERVREEDVG